MAVTLDDVNATLDRIAKLQEESQKRWDKYQEDIRYMREDVIGISKSNGMVAEEYFYNSLRSSKTFGGIHYDYIRRNMSSIRKLPDKTRVEGEYDVVLLNDTSICIIETKYKVRKEDIYKLVNKDVANFKLLFPDYADCDYYLGIGGWCFDDNSEAIARGLGIGIIKLNGDALEVNDTDLKAY
jgi:hypothetical protein